MDRGIWVIIGVGVLGLAIIVTTGVVSHRQYTAKRTACLEEMGRAHVSPKRADEVCP